MWYLDLTFQMGVSFSNLSLRLNGVSSQNTAVISSQRKKAFENVELKVLLIVYFQGKTWNRNKPFFLVHKLQFLYHMRTPVCFQFGVCMCLCVRTYGLMCVPEIYFTCNLFSHPPETWLTVHYQRPVSMWTLLLSPPWSVIHPSFLSFHQQLCFHSLSLDDPHFLRPCSNNVGHTSVHSLGFLISG